MKYLLILCVFLLACSTSNAQKAEDLVSWNVTFSKPSVEVGQTVELIFKAKIESGWHMYGHNFDRDCGPLITEFDFEESKGIEVVGGLKEIGSHAKFDEIFECDITDFTSTAEFRQKIKITALQPTIEVGYFYQVCMEMGMCLNGEGTFDIPEINVVATTQPSNPEPAEKLAKVPSDEKEIFVELPKNSTSQVVVVDTNDQEVVVNVAPKKKEVSKCPVERRAGFDDIEVILQPHEEQKEDFWSLFGFFWIAFGAGLVALITPCMFPMIPMTVNFFTSSSSSRMAAIKKAIIYGLSIIVIYVLLGFIIAMFSGPETANLLATHWIPNLVFFAVFVIFSLSFLGMFDITLPSRFVNKMDEKSEKGGAVGIFFMAMTLVVVSFSCTGPIAGTLLVEATGGEVLKPVIGMLGYSLAFAIPFTLFAMFPSMMSNLPKSGGWLNSVKVVLGLLELALAFKFLSIADLTSHWGILDRDVFLVIWIAIFTVTALYLLGKIQFPHDSPMGKLGVIRSLIAMATIAFVMYLIPGLWGAPLKGLAGVLPPMSTQDFYLAKEIRDNTPVRHQPSSICETPLHSDQLEWPLGIEGYFDMRQAICCAWEQDKPIFIDFTGHGCANCRMMEASVWSDSEVKRILKEDYVKVALYGDDRQIKIPEAERYTTSEGVKVKFLSHQATDFMVSKFGVYGQPYYAILDIDKEKSTNGKIVLKEVVPSRGFKLDVKEYIQFLKSGLEASKD